MSMCICNDDCVNDDGNIFLFARNDNPIDKLTQGAVYINLILVNAM